MNQAAVPAAKGLRSDSLRSAGLTLRREPVAVDHATCRAAQSERGPGSFLQMHRNAVTSGLGTGPAFCLQGHWREDRVGRVEVVVPLEHRCIGR